jgi:hypothetical protein
MSVIPFPSTDPAGLPANRPNGEPDGNKGDNANKDNLKINHQKTPLPDPGARGFHNFPAPDFLD